MYVTTVPWIPDERCFSAGCSISRMRRSANHTNKVTCDTWVIREYLYIPEVTRGSVPTRSSRGIWEVWLTWLFWLAELCRSSGIHRTVVTYVTIVLFHSNWPTGDLALDDLYQKGHEEYSPIKGLKPWSSRPVLQSQWQVGMPSSWTATSGLPDLAAQMGVGIRTSELLASPMMFPSGIVVVEASGLPSKTAWLGSGTLPSGYPPLHSWPRLGHINMQDRSSYPVLHILQKV